MKTFVVRYLPKFTVFLNSSLATTETTPWINKMTDFVA